MRKPVHLLPVLFLVAVGWGYAGDAVAHSYTHGEIMIGHAWAPPTEANSGAIFIPFINRGGAEDALTAATTPIADEVGIRPAGGAEGDRMPSLALPPKQPVALTAWREHLWMTGLEEPLREGDRFDLTLDFAEAGPITIEVYVEAAPGH